MEFPYRQLACSGGEITLILQGRHWGKGLIDRLASLFLLVCGAMADAQQELAHHRAFFKLILGVKADYSRSVAEWVLNLRIV